MTKPFDYDSLDQDTSDDIRQNLMINSGVSPDARAKAINDGQALGVDPGVIERNPGGAARMKAASYDYDSLTRDNPGVADFYRNPENAAIAHDDMDTLRRIDTASKKTWSDAGYGKALKKGWHNTNAALLHMAAVEGLASPEDVAESIAERKKRSKEIEALRPVYSQEFQEMAEKEGGEVTEQFQRVVGSFDELKRGHIAKGLADYIGGGFMTAGEALDFLGQAVIRPRGLGYMVSENLANSALPIGLGVAGAVAGGQAAGLLGGPFAPITAPVGATIGFVGGGAAGSVPIEIGAWIDQEMEKRGVDQTDPQQILKAYQDKEFIQKIRNEGRKKGVTVASVEALFSIMGGKILKAAKPNIASQAVTKLKETGLEVTSEIGGEGGGQLAATGDIKKVDLGDALTEGFASLGQSAGQIATRQAIQSGKLGIRKTLPADPIEATEELVRKSEQSMQAAQSLASFAETGQAVADSKLLQRSPEKVAELIRAATGENASVFFQTDEWDNYWIKKGVSPVEAAAKIIGDNGKAYSDAKASGVMLQLPAADFVTKTTISGDFDAMMKDARLKADGPKLSEAVDTLKAVPETLAELANEVKAQETAPVERADSSRQEIEADVFRQLEQTGKYTTAESKQQAALWGQVMSTFAKEQGLDPKELYDRYGLQVTGGDVEALASAQAAAERDRLNYEATREFDDIADAGGVTPLQDAVRRLGGIRPQDVTREMVDMADLHRKDARPIDDVVADLREAGIDVESSLDLKDKLFAERQRQGAFEAKYGKKGYEAVRRRVRKGSKGEKLFQAGITPDRKEGQSAIDWLGEEWNSLDEYEKRSRLYHDVVTLTLNEKAFQALKPEGYKAAVVSVDGVKYVNDTLKSHDAGDDLYQYVGQALMSAAPLVTKHGGDFAVWVKDQSELDGILAKAKEAMPSKMGLGPATVNGKSFTLAGSIGDTIGEANETHKQVKSDMEKAGERAARGQMPNGWQTFEGITPEPMPATWAEIPANLPFDETTAFDKAYKHPDGTLTWEGFYYSPTKGTIGSIDLDFLGLVNEKYGREAGDRLLAKFTAVFQAMLEENGFDPDFTHKSGDEFLFRHNDREKLEATAKEAIARLAEIDVNLKLTNEAGSENHVLGGISLGIGIGGSYGEAEARLKQSKESRADERTEEALDARIRKFAVGQDKGRKPFIPGATSYQAGYDAQTRDRRMGRSVPKGKTGQERVRDILEQAGRAVDQTQTPEFKAWFGDSKVVDADGKPLVVYHGTKEAFDTFSLSKMGLNGLALGAGIYFTNSESVASGYGNAMSVYLSAKNPTFSIKKKTISKAQVKSIVEALEKEDEYFLSNYGDVETEGRAKVLALALDDFYSTSKNDAEVISSMINVGGISRDTVMRAVIEFTGKDGFVADASIASMGAEAGDKIYTVLLPTQIKSATGNRGTFDPTDANILNQDSTRGKARGQIIITDDTKLDISLLAKADRSTFLHESAHAFLAIMADMAKMPTATPAIKSRFDAALKFMGVESVDGIKTTNKTKGSKEHKKAIKAHEKFAVGFEEYLLTGKAPTNELKEMFATFKTWLRSVYKRVRSLGVQLSPSTREMFDRLFATDQELAQANQELGVEPLPGLEKNPEYAKAVADARRVADETLTAKAMRQIENRKRSEWKDERDALINEYELWYLQEPIYRALKDLQTGDIKIDKQNIIDLYGEHALPKVKPLVYAEEGGLPVDAVSENYGFSSADEMLKAIQNTEPLMSRVAREADEEMKRRHGDMLFDGSIEDEARSAVSNEQHAKVLRLEFEHIATKEKPTFKGLMRRIAGQIPNDKEIKAWATDAVAKMPVKSIRPIDYYRAQIRARKESIELFLKGDIDGALNSKQREIRANALYRASQAAREDIDSIVKYMRGFDKPKTRERIGKAGGNYLDQIDALAERYSFKPISNKSVERRISLRQFADDMAAQNIPMSIPDYLLDDSEIVSYKEADYSELSDMRDLVKEIEHKAIVKNKLLKNKLTTDADKAVALAVETIEANSKGARPKEIETRLPQLELMRMGAGFFAAHKKMASIFRMMDGFEDGGPMWNMFVRPWNEVANEEASMRAVTTKRMMAIMKVYGFKDVAGLYTKKFIPKAGISVSKSGALAMALNWGNEDNRAKLMDGYKLNADQIRAVLDTMDKRDWDVVQGVWKEINSFWPEIAAMHKRVHGVEPKRVEPLPFMNKYGQMMSGGYYPLKYDDRQDTKAYSHLAEQAAKDAFQGASARAVTRHGHRKERVEGVKRPIRLDLDVIFEHLNQVVHDLSHYETLIDVNRLLGDKAVQDSIIDHYGDLNYKQILSAVNDIAAGDFPAQMGTDKLVNWIRQGTTIAGLGWNVMTALMQPLGITQSMVRIGPKWVAKGLGRFLGDAARLENSFKLVYDKSSFMRLRGQTQQREINEIRNQIRLRGKLAPIEDSFFWMIQGMQKLVDIPTWLGAYEKAIDGGATEADAVAMADQAVIDSQGGGQVKDLAQVQRGGPMMKLWTNFYSYFSVLQQLTVESVKKTKSIADTPRLIADMFLLYAAPAMLAVALKEAFKGDGDDDDELVEKMVRESAGYLMGTLVFVREIGSAVQGYQGYSGPAGSRAFSEMGKLIKQVEQGEIDEAALRALNAVAGILFHYPSGQVDRTARGTEAFLSGEAGPAAPIFGPPR